MNKQAIRIDPEFEALIPPLTEDEFNQLRENILECGEVYDPLITWKGTLIDGHNRWRIIQEHPEIRYTSIEVIFFSRNEAILWIINNQLGRRNLNKADAIILAQKKSEVTAQAAKEKISRTTAESNKNRANPSSIKNDKAETAPINTQKETAKLAGVSVGTVAQFEQVQKKKPELVDKIRKGEMTIGGAYREVKEEEKTNTERNYASDSELQPIPQYSINDLLKEIECGGENYVKFLRETLMMHSTLYSSEDKKEQVREKVTKIVSNIDAIINLLN